MPSSNLPLNEETLAQAVDELCLRDHRLASVIARFGYPPLWGREPGFPTLIHMILEQQVSLASARAAFDRLNAAVSPLTPAGFLPLDDDQLKEIGFSRQKTDYARLLSQAMIDGTFDPGTLDQMDDETARAALIQLKGIGAWTADVYLLMALRRPDIFPLGDRALVIAVQRLYDLPDEPSDAELLERAEKWRPHRAAAARILWHFYLSAVRPVKPMSLKPKK